MEVFREVLGRRFPENRILSHDLLEGGYVRSGLVSDVVLYENVPPDYFADAKRRLRWIRGDWQIARWLMPTVPGPAGTLRNPLQLLYCWKIFDNLRRSLETPAMLCLLLLAWLNGPAAAWITGSVALAFFLPPLLAALVALLFQKPQEQLFEIHARDTLVDLGRHLARAVIRLAFLPFEAAAGLGAIGRTLFRLWISRQRLLSWTQAGDSARAATANFLETWKCMWLAPALALAAGSTLGWAAPGMAWAGGILALWFGSPLAAWFINRQPVPRLLRISPEQTVFLRKLARRTWHYFETYVPESDHWLPLDNVQERPVPARAHRTSPTNIGLSLLVNLSAYDFGIFPPDNCSSVRPAPCKPWSPWSGFTGIAIIGTTRKRSSLWSPAIFPVWTAAIWPGICWFCARACWRWPIKRWHRTACFPARRIPSRFLKKSSTGPGPKLSPELKEKINRLRGHWRKNPRA